MKESKSLDRFRKLSNDLSKLTQGKSEEEIEKLVSRSDKY
jgi:hypothetical protein